MEIIAKEQKTQIKTNSLLYNIKPAATKLILDGSSTDVIDVIKYTFFDLIIKQVLRVKREYRKAHERDTVLREYVIVETGEKFSEYKFDKFESYFIDIIDVDSFYYLKGYLRKIYKDLPSNYKCYRYVIDGSNVNNNFTANLFTQVFGLTLLNVQGKNFRKEIEKYLTKIDNKILEFLDSNSEEALKIINSLKGNLFLLKNVKFELFEKLKPISNTTTTYSKEYDDISHMEYYFDELFDMITDTFDSIDDFINDNTSFSDWGDTDADF